MVVSNHLSAGNRTWVLYKHKYFSLLSCLSSPCLHSCMVSPCVCPSICVSRSLKTEVWWVRALPTDLSLTCFFMLTIVPNKVTITRTGDLDYRSLGCGHNSTIISSQWADERIKGTHAWSTWYSKSHSMSLAWWPMPFISAFGSQKHLGVPGQLNLQSEFQAS